MHRLLFITLSFLCLTALAIPAGAAAERKFRSESKNISCWMDSGYVRCDIRTKSWHPRKPASCDLDYGNGLIISTRGARGRVLCAGDTLLGERSPILKYGRSVSYKGFKCTAKSSGVTCRNKRGHGFVISKDSYKLF